MQGRQPPPPLALQGLFLELESPPWPKLSLKVELQLTLTPVSGRSPPIPCYAGSKVVEVVCGCPALLWCQEPMGGIFPAPSGWAATSEALTVS